MGTRKAISRLDLSQCTRIEMRYWPSPLDYICGTDLRTLLTPSEIQFLQSPNSLLIEDPNAIRTLAQELAFAVDTGMTQRGPIGIKDRIYLDGYRDKELFTSMEIIGDWILVKNGPVFKGEFKNPALLTPQLRPFWLRINCGINLEALRWGEAFRNQTNTYPKPDEWCDAFIRAAEAANHTGKDAMRLFRCPGRSNGKCHYAMNPDCGPNSPPDTVLLFETRAGWNQHGGPELFTFDNHDDPKGGCVVLNDGTAKFIRTKDELAQLRWKP